VLSHKSNLPEVLWNFSRLKGKKRVTLKQNPHFYKFPDLPKGLKQYHGGFKVDPIENFQQEHTKFWVITNKPGRIFLETPRHTRAFGNVWHVPDNNAIIFKGSLMTLPFPSFLLDSRPPLDVCGKLEGEDIVHASIRGPSDLWNHKELPSSPTSSPPAVS